MSKLKTAEEIANNYLYINVEATGEDMVKAIKEAQRNAIEVALELASEKAMILKVTGTKKESSRSLRNIVHEFYIDTDSILNLKNSKELKV